MRWTRCIGKGTPGSLILAGMLAASCDVGVPPLDDLFADADGNGALDAGGDGVGVQSVQCARLENSFPGPLCSARERSSVSFRFLTDPGTRGTLQCSAQPQGPFLRLDESEAAALHHLVLTGLDPVRTYICAYGAIQGEMAGDVAWSVTLDPVPPVGGPVVTEVLANPEGTEPAQEFVEIYNPGPDVLDLTGYRLMDVDPAGLPDPMDGGDGLPAGQILEPGTLALLVPESFSTTGPDPAPEPGCLIIRLDGSLARSGLRNSGGEPVYLVAPDATAVSSYPNLLGTSDEGFSVQRLLPDGPGGDPANWIQDEPTPGAL